MLGIVGALDPHTHKVNQADIQGEGKLEREGVRPQRQHDPTGGLGGGAATTLGDSCFLATSLDALPCPALPCPALPRPTLPCSVSQHLTDLFGTTALAQILHCLTKPLKSE